MNKIVLRSFYEEVAQAMSLSWRPKAMRLIYIFLCLKILSCRGYVSDQPPVHLNPNMDTQEKGKAYRESDFFEDGMYMRPPIAGTIARGELKSPNPYGKQKINEASLNRGQQLFNRTCAACHGHVGDGDGLVGRRLMVKPTSLHSEYMYNQKPQHFFDVIQHGIRTMQPYGFMINEQDSWAIVTYIRALQMSQDSNGEWIKRSASWWKQ
jgi:mono/diheme cytochrome c family protein